MSKVIGIFSAKGGVGKTTTAINLASALNEFGRNTILVDTDLTSPNLGMYLGVHNSPNTLNRVIQGKARIEDSIYMHHSGINMILGSVKPSEAVTDFEKIDKELSKLTNNFEIILVDSAPGHFKENISSIDSINEVLVITTPELAAVTDALRTIAIAKEFGKKVIGAVLTRHGSHEFEMSKENIESMLGVAVLGVIPEDPNIALSARVNSPVLHSHPHSSASAAYKELAAAILGERYKKISREDTIV